MHLTGVSYRGRMTSFSASNNGALAPIFAIMLLVVMGAGLLALDAARFIGAKIEANHIADSAALFAIKEVADLLHEDFDTEISRSQLEEQARLVFESHLGNGGMTLTNLTLNYRNADSEHFVDLDYAVEVPSLYSEYPVDVTGSITTGLSASLESQYMDLHLLIDMSSSMSTGASLEDQRELWSTQGCAFACHEESVAQARASGIELRHDKVIAALHLLADKVKDAIGDHQLQADAIRFHLWTFNEELAFLGSTTDLSTFRVQLDMLSQIHPADSTNLHAALTTLANVHLPQSGSGASPTDRQSFVFLMSDAIADLGHRTYRSPNNIGAIHPVGCNAIKQTGATMAIIHTEYQNYAETMRDVYGTNTRNGFDAPGNNLYYSGWVDHWNRWVLRPTNHLDNQLESCADEGFLFRTANGAEMNDAISQFFRDAVQLSSTVPRLITYTPHESGGSGSNSGSDLDPDPAEETG